MGCIQTKAHDGLGDAQSPPSAPSGEKKTIEAGDLDVIFVDCDDTLYFNNWATAIRLRDKISQFTHVKLGLEDSYAWQLYQKYGTALRGLLNEGLIPPERIEEYLHAVHDVPLHEINRDLELRKMFLQMQVRRWVFTASTREHAMRCMRRVGVDDLFEGIIDCREVNLVTKHDPESFRIAMKRAGVTDPSRCMLLDDSVQNIRSAKSMGMRTCLVGLLERDTNARLVCPEADFEVDRLIELKGVLPGLFAPSRRFSTIASKRLSMIAQRRISQEELDIKANAPQVVFVLGPPGCGKGTNCVRAAGAYNALHLSAGDLLRAEQANPKSEVGALISKHMTEGSIVPVDITCGLLLKAIQQSPTKRILVDGFPRSMDNLDGWYRIAHDYVNTLGVLFFEVDDEDELARRILERAKTSGRSDDNEEVLKKRFNTMRTITLPVVQRLDNELTVRRVNALDTFDNVWNSVQMALDGWWTKQPMPAQRESTAEGNEEGQVQIKGE